MTDENTVFDAAFEYQMNGMSEENARVAASEDEAKDARIAQLEGALLYYREEYCEHGGELCGRLSSDACGGCNAATALKAKP